MTGFQLYPRERHFWSYADYAAVVSVVRRLKPPAVLEFGPGSSTLALLEGGAASIDSCEDDFHWLATNRSMLAPHRAVELHAYTWGDPLTIPALDARRYAFALIDGPHSEGRRPACIEYALQRCDAVMVALECAQGSDFLSAVCRSLAEKHGRAIEVMETGPLAGAFAVLT